MENYFTQMTDHERELSRRIHMENVKELVLLLVGTILFVVVAWLYMVGTPDQLNAENDINAEVAHD